MPRSVFIHHNHCTSLLSSPPSSSSPRPLFSSITLCTMQMDEEDEGEASEWGVWREEKGGVSGEEMDRKDVKKITRQTKVF